MSDCRCSGTPGQNDTWDYHSDYCPVFMQGQINALEQERDKLRDRVQELGNIAGRTSEFNKWWQLNGCDASRSVIGWKSFVFAAWEYQQLKIDALQSQLASQKLLIEAVVASYGYPMRQPWTHSNKMTFIGGKELYALAASITDTGDKSDETK